VFDGYAPRFDAHLIGLGYRIPGLIRRVLQTVAPLAGPLLDLGCGTGLIAVAAADLFDGPLIGVDLSERMLAEAKRRNLYAELHHTDIEAFLASDSRQYACVLAGDVMPYFGDLRPLLRAVAERMLPGGRLMLSLEALPADQDHLDGWRLGRLGRYAHTPHHVTTAAAVAGLTTAAMRTETVRMEAGAPVAGLFVVLAREAV
jgi:predicted TPR repeat methyltransferase